MKHAPLFSSSGAKLSSSVNRFSSRLCFLSVGVVVYVTSIGGVPPPVELAFAPATPRTAGWRTLAPPLDIPKAPNNKGLCGCSLAVTPLIW